MHDKDCQGNSIYPDPRLTVPMQQKRVLAIHDVSCFGRCSLTVALPIISATGSECTVIPTAVLSTHTGGFEGYTYRDLTEDILPIVEHWKGLDLRFDAVYTGFLGSFEQIGIVSGIFDRLKAQGTLIAVDPVMADNGKLYGIFPEDFPRGMRDLCAKADVIMPNITEACLMTGKEYVEGPYAREWVDDLLERLSSLGARQVILTGVFFETGTLGAAAHDAAAGTTDYAFRDLVPGYYHGTGDVFGSVAVAALVNGFGLAEANRFAVDFTVDSIIRSREAGTDVRFGVNFEAGIAGLLRDMEG